MKGRRKPRGEEIEELYRALDGPPADVDCGALCSGDGGEPLCCVADLALPAVFDWEWTFLRSRTGMLERWRPARGARVPAFVDRKAACDVFVRCHGARACDREWRPLVCRTFPLEPLVAADWAMVGVAFNSDFEGRCALEREPGRLRPEFVRACILAWNRILSMEPETHAIYREWSASRWSRAERRGEPVRGFDLLCRWGPIGRPGRGSSRGARAPGRGRRRSS